jgi:hypothetical protein
MSPTSWMLRAALASGLAVLLAHAPIASAQPGNGLGGTDNGGAANPPRAPSITSINTQQVPGQKFRVYGRVDDDTPGTCGVEIRDAATDIPMGIAMCDAHGNFDYTVNVPVVPVSIKAIPGDGSQSGPPVVRNLANNAPSVTVSAVQGPNNTWNFRGNVGDECPEGMIVTLAGPAGVNGVTATVLANGAYSVTVTLSPNASGQVTATTTDWYGQTGSGSTYFGS